MKGKLKFLYSTILCLTACLVASVCLFAAVSRRSQVVQAVGVRTDDYSLFDINTGAIMSVEKVAVQAGSNARGEFINSAFTTKLYSSYTDAENNVVLPKMYSYNHATSDEPTAIYYKDIANGGHSKYVVGDGEFVMLNNTFAEGEYRSQYQGTAYTADNTPVRLQEAILVSLGQYCGHTDEQGDFDYDGKAGQFGEPQSQSGADLESLSVYAWHNGQTMEVPGPRTYENADGRNKEDFVWVIPQTEGVEGFYQFEFTFRYNGNFTHMQFSFYILLGESYYGTLADSNGNTYSAQPNLSLQSGTDRISHFYLGESDLSNQYPTLTYDVTKYDMSYTHTANGVETRYNFVSVASAGMMNLVCTKTGPNGSTSQQTYPLGPVGTKGNIAVVVFTEMGRYNISYRYKYQGYNADRSPAMNLTMDNNQLVIHGVELKYAKAGFNEAQMRHITFANNANSNTDLMGVGLVVPNGYRNEEITPGDISLGVLYDYDTTNKDKVGAVLKNESANVEHKKVVDTNEDDLDAYLTATGFNISFAKTNQGVLWFDAFDGDLTGSYYYFAPTQTELKNKITTQTDKRNYTNTNSFNETGYYLVFIKIKVNGKNYTSVFAFQYSNAPASIHTAKLDEDENETPLATGEYTNGKVKIWWEEPGVFERAISVKFLQSAPNTYPTWEELATQIDSSGTEIGNGAILGGEIGLGAVAANTGSIFLIKLQSVGKNAIYRTFIVDKQPIFGVQAYAVESGINRLENVFYSVVKNQDGTNLAISNSITNTYATLGWQEKASRAKITATFSFTPFVVDSKAKIGTVTGTSTNKEWITTNYKLGTTIDMLDLQRPNLEGELSSSSVLFQQGIYLFTLTDEASNSCEYMFVIDQTENYFKITDSEGDRYSTRENLLYVDNVTISVGTDKVFELSNAGSAGSAHLFEIINAAATGTLGNTKYYSQPGTNSGNLRDLFATLQNKFYLTVANKDFYIYDNQQELLEHKTVGTTQTSRSYLIEASGSSTVRQFYVVGANQIVLDSALNSNSYEIVEVNTDHSFGTAYYSDKSETLLNFNNLTESGANGATRLYYDDDGKKTGIQGAHATGANYLAFSWRMGSTDKYKVKSVIMQFYELDLNEETFGDNYYYKNSAGSVSLYGDSGLIEGALVSGEENPHVVVVLNVARYQTLAGLYVITREYEQPLGVDEKDTQVLKYYYIVDRNGIIAAVSENEISINGGFISVGLRDNISVDVNDGESQFRKFSTDGVPTGTIYPYDDTTRKLGYNVYLTTTRLPAVLNIPVGKYFYSNSKYLVPGLDYHGSEYYAGKLNFDLYFADITPYQLLGLPEADKNCLLLCSSSMLEGTQAGYFKLDIARNLSDSAKERFVGGGNGEYLTLPGDYILVISDNVEGITNQKVIGIRVLKNNGPTTDIYSVRNQADTYAERVDTAGENLSLTTAKEFVVVDMKKAEQQIGTEIFAELDLDYLHIVQNYDGVISNYVMYDHGTSSGTINIDSEDRNNGYSQRETEPDDKTKTVSRKIYLETFLRDSENNILDYETLKKPLTYTVTIRYKIVSADGLDTQKYANCYYYYDETGKHQCYETSYTITIDRVPPQANTINLEQQDSMVGYYTDGEMFENAILTDGSDVTFVRRMKEYYASASKDKANLYAFHVSSSTPYDITDIASIHTRKVSIDTLSLTLPADFSRVYEGSFVTASTFGDFNFEGGCYYEVLEQDAAGNTTQYLVYYESGTEGFDMNFTGTVARNGEFKPNENITFSFNGEGASYTISELKESAAPGMPTAGNDNADFDRFYRFELFKNGALLAEFTTDFGTNFNAHPMQTALKTALNDYGNYTLRLISEHSTVTYTINHLTNSIFELTPRNMVKQYPDGRYYIDLAAANDSATVPGVTVYATKIVIKGERPDDAAEYHWARIDENGNCVYEDVNGVQPENNCVSVIGGRELSGSYRITITDIFGNEYYYNFNTNGAQPFDITFGEDGQGAYSQPNPNADVYYGFTQANVSYDNVEYSGNALITYTLSIKGSQLTGNMSIKDDQLTSNGDLFEDGHIIVRQDGGRTRIVIMPYFEDGNKTGATLSVTIRLSNEMNKTDEYRVIIDTSTGAVSLKDNEDEGANREYVVELNKFGDDELLSVVPTTTYAGIFYLSWVPTQSDWFDYDYTIYEEMQNGLLRFTNLNGTTNYVISTQEESTGKYRFVITIKNKDGDVLGNKVYAFAVQSPVNEIYSVRTTNGQALLPNSTFTFKEISAFNYNKELDGTDGVIVPVDPMSNENSIPLYVYNQDVVVDIAKNIGAHIDDWLVFERLQGNAEYTFTIYRVYSAQNTYNFYFGTLIVSRQDDLVDNLKMLVNGDATEINSPYLSQNNNKFYGTSDTKFVLSGSHKYSVTDTDAMNIIRKNTIVLSVWCNGEYVADVDTGLKTQGNDFSYEILGSGQFGFVFKDLAGNTHNFNQDPTSGNSGVVNELNLIAMREVVLLVNGSNAVDNAFYNGQVEVRVFNPGLYSDIRSIVVNCKRNGEDYKPEINQYTYLFKELGNYRITATAQVGEITLSKVLVFTIVSANEARQSFDLTNVFNYQITKVLNNRGDDITSEFLNLMNARQGEAKYLLTYDFLLENSEALGITSGKQMFSITYLIEDGIYSAREIEFAFSLNNQVPTIQSSVSPGGSTKKSFTITYTPAIIYDQVGDCELYINDILVCTIDANSANATTPQSYKISYDKNGKGDYYVILRSMSGTVHTSFKITVKEPLNTWSIIIIVVVVVIIGAVVGTIIFLRKRMKIR